MATMHLSWTVMEIWRLKCCTHVHGHSKKNGRKERERKRERNRERTMKREKKGEGERDSEREGNGKEDSLRKVGRMDGHKDTRTLR